MPHPYHERLQKIRIILHAQQADALVLSVNDEFFSEYPPERFQRLAWLTGFDGSAGTVVITAESAAFFTDGRYTLQAAEQLNTEDYTLYNSGETSPLEWLAQYRQTPAYAGVTASFVIAIDPWLWSHSQFQKWQKALPTATWKHLTPNLIDTLWEDQPALSAQSGFIYPLEYAGQSREEKLTQIAALLQRKSADAVLLTVPESVAWLLNLRGYDIAHTPLLLARAIVYADGSYELFADTTKIPAPLMPAERSLESACKALAGKAVMLDPAQTPLALMPLLEGGKVIEAEDPCILPRACKNNTEVGHIAATHLTDGLALTQFLYHLSSPSQSQEWTEISAAEKLESLRRAAPDFLVPSFPTISGFGANGAIVHYRATEASNRRFEGNMLYLVDSGGQYWGGTTDVTRTLAWGTPTAAMKRHYTLVLKGHIALAQAVFPRGTSGRQLDALARQFLWQDGLDYDHGTGHGVGCFLGVHEGPQGIGKMGRDAVLQTGMILSNEPGYYLTGQYGIRLENLVVVKESAQNGFLKFETLTCAPFDPRLLEPSLLTATEKHWWNTYHAWVKEQLSPRLPADCAAWLAEICRGV